MKALSWLVPPFTWRKEEGIVWMIVFNALTFIFFIIGLVVVPIIMILDWARLVNFRLAVRAGWIECPEWLKEEPWKGAGKL